LYGAYLAERPWLSLPLLCGMVEAPVRLAEDSFVAARKLV
jgi:hypothetical protein